MQTNDLHPEDAQFAARLSGRIIREFGIELEHGMSAEAAWQYGTETALQAGYEAGESHLCDVAAHVARQALIALGLLN